MSAGRGCRVRTGKSWEGGICPQGPPGAQGAVDFHLCPFMSFAGALAPHVELLGDRLLEEMGVSRGHGGEAHVTRSAFLGRLQQLAPSPSCGTQQKGTL